MKVVKRAGRQWTQGTITIADGGTSATTVAQALVNLGYIPSSSLGQPNGTVPLVGGVIPKEYLGLTDTGPVAVMGNTRMMAGSQRTLSITNFDSFGTYVIAAKYGTVGTLSVAGATAGDFLYTAPATKPVEGKDTITINGIGYDVEIIGSSITKPSIVSPVENYSGEVGNIGTITSTAYNAGSTTIIDSVTIGGAGSFATPSGTEKIRVVNRSQASVVVSQAGTTKTIPANSEMEWTGTGTWVYSVIVGRVLVEFLKGVSSHASSDWQIATDLAFTNIVKQSASDTVNKVSWPGGLTTSGVYYIRVRHRDVSGAMSDWSDARRIAPIAAAQTRQTSWTTNWTSQWYTNWTTNYSAGSHNTTAQTTGYNYWNTSVSGSRSTSGSSSWSASRSTLYQAAGNVSTSWSTYRTDTSQYNTSWTTTSAARLSWWQTAAVLMGSQSTSIMTEGHSGGAEGGGASDRLTTWTSVWYYNGYINTYAEVAGSSQQTSQLTNGGSINVWFSTSQMTYVAAVYQNTSWTTSTTVSWTTSYSASQQTGATQVYNTTWSTADGADWRSTSYLTSAAASRQTSVTTLI